MNHLSDVYKNSLLIKKNSQATLITMSTGMSMTTWENAGIIQRELAYYKALSKYIGNLLFLTYGEQTDSERHLLRQYIPGAQIVRMGSRLFSRIPNGFFMASFVPPFFIHKFHSLSMVRTNQISGSWAGISIARQKNIPFILRCGYLMSKNVHLDKQASIIKKKLTWLLEKWVARHAHAIIVTYPGAKKYLIDNHRIYPEKIIVIGNPIDIDRFSPLSICSKGKRDVLFIGRFMPEKNIQSILSACHKAKASITLLGKGPLKSEMVQYANALKLNAEFIDYMPNPHIPQLMDRHRLFLIASHYEGNPKALLEAMSCEMPCIASHIPEHNDLILHEKEGLLAPPSAKSLSEAIQQILSNESFGHTLGKNARKKILAEYSLESNALKESRLHEQVLKNFHCYQT
ncbi:MAG: glycosyltransferase family 4 protein [Candidatus Magnetomorum sp.]|nr:glycosyltransferase family 4 protein [Candidatus Magnetomorum sp.]